MPHQPSSSTRTSYCIMACRGLLCVAISFLTAGCLGSHDREVIVYTALDRDFSEPIFDRFTAKTGIHVRAKYDSESTKTLQLVTEIIARARNPRCDLFWNNEIVNTMRLDQRGLLASYRPALADDFPAEYRSPQATWHGFAARVRVLLVNENIVPPDEMPDSILDLIDPTWQNKVAIAKPLFGTTATHAVCLFHYWGKPDAQQYFVKLAKNAKIMSGNKAVAEAVASGEVAFGLTDTDDAIIEVNQGKPVQIVWPDQGETQMGALMIPNSLALIQGSPHHDLARQLVDFLLSPDVEEDLAQGPSAQIPLNKNVHLVPELGLPNPLKKMQVNFVAAASQWEAVGAFLEQEFSVAK